MSVAVPFPDVQPPGFEWLDGEEMFDPARHLQLETPADVVLLADLGYTPEEIDRTATPVAISAPFRVLSEEGAEVMLVTARRLRAFAGRAADRIERVVRGGCHRSRWLRDLCTSPEVAAHVARIYGTPVAPHPMPLHLGHLNYEPSAIDTAVDKWHHDTLPLDYVLAVTGPASVEGGRFEYFLGTKDEAASLATRGHTPPADRIVAPELPGAGWAIALHGDMVVHRAGPLTTPGERITMVNGYVALDTSLADQSRSADLISVDPPEVLWTEWAKFAAWRSRNRLDALLAELPYGGDRDGVIRQLTAAIEDVERAIGEMRAGAVAPEHYGG